MVYCICGSSLLRTFKNSVALLLLPNQAWESSTLSATCFCDEVLQILSDRITIIERPIKDQGLGPKLSKFQITLSQRK